MAETETKPRFDVVKGVTTISTDDESGKEIVFNATAVGPLATYSNLVSQAQHIGGYILNGRFVLATLGQVVPLIHATYRAEKNFLPESAGIKLSLSRYGITSQTRALIGRLGLLVFDESDDFVFNLRGSSKDCMDYLSSKLGRLEENGVVYSDDMKIRFTPSFKTGPLTYLDFPENSAVIALLGSPERAEMLVRSFYQTSHPRSFYLSNEFQSNDTLFLSPSMKTDKNDPFKLVMDNSRHAAFISYLVQRREQDNPRTQTAS